jgi:hypothetical protein
MSDGRGKDSASRWLPRGAWGATAIAVLVVAAAAGVLLSQAGGGSDEEAARETRAPATRTAPQPQTTPRTERTPRAERPKRRQPRRRSEQGNRSGPRRGPTTKEARPSDAEARRIRRSYEPRKGEAVVPNKAQCTGPDVFDQPGCETVPAP